MEFDRAVTNADSGSIVGRDGVFRFDEGLTNNGLLAFSKGGTDIFGDVNNTSSGRIHVGGEGTATFYGNVTTSGSILVQPESTLFFARDVTLDANASLALAGLAEDPQPAGEPSVDDSLNVAGKLQLGGALALSSSADPADVTEPSDRGEAITLSLLSAGQLSGAFERVTYNSATLNVDFLGADGRSFRSYDSTSDLPGMFRSIVYSSSGVEVVSYLAIPGDTNGDRSVNFSDFLTLADNFGGPGTWPQGDFDGNGMVLFPDFLSLAENFGSGVATAQSVPEPSSWTLGFCLCTVLLRRRRRS